MSVSENNILCPKYKEMDNKYNNISEYLTDYLLIHKENDLIIDYTENITLNGQQIYDLSETIAKSLINEFHLKKGEIVCIFSTNHYFQVICLSAVLSAGAVCLFINEGSTYAEMENILEKTNFKHLFCVKENEIIAKKLSQNYSVIKNVFIIAEQNYKSNNDFTNIYQLLKHKPEYKAIDNDIRPSDAALIEMTCGTTDGNRKPVIKTHSNLIQAINMMQNKDGLSNSSDDIILSVPFHKLFGVSLLLNSLISGSKAVIIMGSFETHFNSFMESIENLKISKLIVFSSNVKLMIRNEVNLLYNISSVKEIIHIGVFDDYTLMRDRVENMFKLRYFRAVYGTTESGVISCLHRSKSYERNGYSSGQLIPGNQLKVLDLITGDSLPAHKIGEICVKSKQLSPGYLSEDKSALNSDSFTKDGYFKTSDAGYYDSEGRVYVESRVQDIICIENQILNPNELEILLLSHLDVIECTVIGIYEDFEDDSEEPIDESNDCYYKLNNSFKIFVVLKVGSDTSDLDLINFINDRVEPIRQIDSRIFIVDMLPRNSTGIINRSLLTKY